MILVPCVQEVEINEIKTNIALLQQSDAVKEKKLDKIDGNVSKIVYFMLGTFVTGVGSLLAILVEVFV